MAKFGRLSSTGLIYETHEAVDADDLATHFVASIADQFVSIPDNAAVGDTYADGTLTPAPVVTEPEPEAPVDPRLAPAAEFWSALTRAERIAIRASTDANVVDFRNQLEVNGHVDLADADEQALFTQLVTDSVLSQASVDAVNALR